MDKTVIIIGAGPAGLTAAYELLTKSDIKPIIYEQSSAIGGISRTINYKGNRIDIGGHRFFSKSDTVMEWWKKILPLQSKPAYDDLMLKRNVMLSTNEESDPEKNDCVMLIRNRLSRILYLRKFFNYPVNLSKETINNLGLCKMFRIGTSYLIARLAPIMPEKSLEDFFINRFGNELYRTFFKDYTEKVWGVACNTIKPEWGAQRIKGLSISKALLHALKSFLPQKESSINQKNVETSLIEYFMYPKLGPGQLWEEVAKKILSLGGEIHLNHTVEHLEFSEGKIVALDIRTPLQEPLHVKGDYVISTMPVKDLVAAMGKNVPKEVQDIASGLQYRDFITVGMLLHKLKITNETAIKTLNGVVPDNWIYIQESDVKIGRLQIFNNWSPYLVASHEHVWIGLEYFCNEGDALWTMEDSHFIDFAKEELEKIGIIDAVDFIDATVIRVPKTYPAYFGTYDSFDTVKDFTDSIENLFLIGRNGMHKYNNMDHSMLSAMEAVKNILNSVTTKENIWATNAEQDYHESK
jgi:protoporphyrinogen oxidase